MIMNKEKMQDDMMKLAKRFNEALENDNVDSAAIVIDDVIYDVVEYMSQSQ